MLTDKKPHYVGIINAREFPAALQTEIKGLCPYLRAPEALCLEFLDEEGNSVVVETFNKGDKVFFIKILVESGKFRCPGCGSGWNFQPGAYIDFPEIDSYRGEWDYPLQSAYNARLESFHRYLTDRGLAFRGTHCPCCHEEIVRTCWLCKEMR